MHLFEQQIGEHIISAAHKVEDDEAIALNLGIYTLLPVNSISKFHGILNLLYLSDSEKSNGIMKFLKK